MKINILNKKHINKNNPSINFEQISSSLNRINKYMAPVLNEDMKTNTESIKKIKLLISNKKQMILKNKQELNSLMNLKNKNKLKKQIITTLNYFISNFNLSFDQLIQSQKILERLDKINIDQLKSQLMKLKKITKSFLER